VLRGARRRDLTLSRSVSAHIGMCVGWTYSYSVVVVGASNASLDGEGARGEGTGSVHGICVHTDRAAEWAYLHCALGPMAMKTNNVHFSPRLAAVSHWGLTDVLMRQPATSLLTTGIAGVLHSIGLAV
jgi:hypothetical protein